MLQVARSHHRDIVEGRWVIVTRHRRNRWEIVVEPDVEAAILVVITAYRAD